MPGSRKLNQLDSDYERLRRLLFGPELERLKELEDRLTQLRQVCDDPREITRRVLPLFDEILAKRFEEDGGRIRAILAEHITEILARASHEDSARLGEALKEVIAPAISREIEENRDRMVDALYPIMGGMIARYVANAIQELREKIDRKIEERFSVKALKRKVKARLSGVSESDLIIEEEVQARIRAIFVIQKETGLLVAESSWQEEEFDDPHLVASMASAIKDFIEEWIHEQREASEVQLVSYGNATLYIESAGSVYLIAFMDREPDYEQREEIHRFFAGLLDRHYQLFQRFEGDDSDPEIPVLQKELDRFIAHYRPEDTVQKQEVTSGVATKFILFFLVLGIAYLLWLWAAPRYRLYRLESSLKRMTGVELPLHEAKGTIIVEGVMESPTRYLRVRKALEHLVPNGYVDRIHLPAVLWIKALKNFEKKQQEELEALEVRQTKSQTELLRRLQALEQRIKKTDAAQKKIKEDLSTLQKERGALRQRIAKDQQRLKQLHTLASLKKELGTQLRRAFAGSPYFNPKTLALDFRTGGLFAPGSALPNQKTLKRLSKEMEKYITILFKSRATLPYLKKIIIEGHTDSRGDAEANRRLSLARAKAVRDYLLALPIAEKFPLASLLEAKGVGSLHPVMHRGKEDYEASRRITLRFELDKGKILDTLGKGSE